MTAITLEQIIECPGAPWAAIELYYGATGLSVMTVDGLLQAVSNSLAGTHTKREALAATSLAWQWLRQLGLVSEIDRGWIGRHAWGLTPGGRRVAAYQQCNGDPEQFVRLAARWRLSEED